MKTDLRIRIGNLELKNPLMTASGTSGYGDELGDYFDVSMLGAIVSKSLTLKPKIGNEPPRVAEVSCGMLNSIGLANIGIEKFISEKLPKLKQSGATMVANIAAKRAEDYAALAGMLASLDDIKGLEVNLSCPNVKEGGIEFGSDAKMLGTITKLVRNAFPRTLLIKLTPNVTRISELATAAEAEGADGVTVANTYVGMAVDIYKRTPKIHTITGGLSGPAIKPLTMAKVFQVRKAVKIPIVASGGAFTWQDVVEYLIAGASAVELGTVLFTKPDVPQEIISGIETYLGASGMGSVAELVGTLRVNPEKTPSR